jgi:hypothetical protein
MAVTVIVSETTLAIQLPYADDLVVRRTTTQTVRSIKASGHEPQLLPQFPRPDVAHQVAEISRTSAVGSHRGRGIVGGAPLTRVCNCSRLTHYERIRNLPGLGPFRMRLGQMISLALSSAALVRSAFADLLRTTDRL